MDVLKLPIDAGKANEGHLIDAAQVFHYQFANLAAFDLGLRVAFQFVLDLSDDPLELGIADRPLPAGQLQAALDLGGIEGLPCAVFLDNFDGRALDPLVGSVAEAAVRALTAAADGKPVMAGANRSRGRCLHGR